MSVIKNLIEHSLMTPSCSISSHGVLEDLHIILMKCCSSFLTFEIFGLIVNLLWKFCMWSSPPLIVYVPCLYLFQMLPYVVCSFIFCGMFWRTDVCNFDDVWCRLLILWLVSFVSAVSQRHCSPFSPKRLTAQQPFACTCLLLHSFLLLTFNITIMYLPTNFSFLSNFDIISQKTYALLMKPLPSSYFSLKVQSCLFLLVSGLYLQTIHISLKVQHSLLPMDHDHSSVGFIIIFI